MYVYLETEAHSVWTVGFYDPQGEWIPESDFGSAAAAAERVSWLNGGAKGCHPNNACPRCGGETGEPFEEEPEPGKVRTIDEDDADELWRDRILEEQERQDFAHDDDAHNMEASEL